MGQNSPDPTDPFYQVNPDTAEELLLLHAQMKNGAINLKQLMEKYTRKFPLDGALRLLFDIQKTQQTYFNLYEELKRLDLGAVLAKRATDTTTPDDREHDYDEFTSIADLQVKFVRAKYVSLGLIPRDHLPNTFGFDYIRDACRNIKQLWQAGVDIVRSYDRELTSALRLDPGTTFSVQVEVKLDGGITVGWERTVGE